MGERRAPHPVLEEVLGTLRLLHSDTAFRSVLREVARIYHEGIPGAPQGVVPLGAVYAYMGGVGAPPATTDFATLGAILHALGLWRLSKGAYLYDPDLTEELADTRIGRVPTELLLRLPEPAPLILLPRGLPSWRDIEGFHVYLEWDPGGRPGVGAHLELRFLAWMRAEGGYRPATLVLDLDAEDLEGAVRRTLARSIRSAPGLGARTLQEAEPLLMREYGGVVSQALSLALFLCQEAPDLGGVAPRPPAPLTWTKGEKKVFPPESPLILPTGWRWGQAIRRARELKKDEEGFSAPTGRRVAPHVRRAHWHLYWTGEGARKDPSRAKPLLKWVPATVVGRSLLEEAGLSPEDLPAVVRKTRR